MDDHIQIRSLIYLMQSISEGTLSRIYVSAHIVLIFKDLVMASRTSLGRVAHKSDRFAVCQLREK